MTAWQRLRQLGTNPLIATEVGRLTFRGDLSSLQADTAFAIARIYGAHDRAIGARRWPASPVYETGRGRDARLFEDDAERGRSERAMAAFDALTDELRKIGKPVMSVVVGLAVDDAAVPPGMMAVAKAALDQLAPVVGMRRRRRA
jgi:hypothetical protein